MEKQNRDFWIAFAALIISVVAAGFTGLQWFEARQARVEDEKHFEIARQDAAQAANDQQTQVERSAVSAERSAKSSENSNSLASESLRLNRQIFQTSERAFIHVKQISFVLEPNKPAQTIVQLENAGRTTAKETRSIANIGFASAPLTQIPNDIIPNVPVTPMDLVAGDTREVPIATTNTVPEDQLERLKSGAVQLYSYGHIEYRDIFDRHHKTTFCARYNKDDPGRAYACPFFNTVD
jgi:hypothetical protein